MRNTILSALLVATITCFYPQKAGKSQSTKVNKTPVVKVEVNPNDKLADERQAEILKTRAKAEQIQQEVIKDLKKEIAQKNVAKVKIVYKTIYKKTIDTVFIPMPLGASSAPLDSNDYYEAPHKCKADTVYLPKKTWIQKIFGSKN